MTDLAARSFRPARLFGLLPAAALVLAAAAPAQLPAHLQFADGTEAVPAIEDPTAAVALSDVDGDGDLDLVVGNHGQNRILRNDGHGGYEDATAALLPVDGDTTNAVAFGDVDGDGDPDLVCGNSTHPVSQNRLYLNDGSGAFTDVTVSQLPVHLDWTNDAALGDVDGDGDLDLVFGNSGQNRLYENDGVGTFTDVTASHMPADNDWTNAVSLVDVDGDGDLDLVCGNGWPQPDRLYENDGSGTFTDVTAARMPASNAVATSISVADIDGDGDQDLLLTGLNVAGFSIYDQDRLYRNDGSGTFTDVTAQQLPGGVSSSAAFGDVDGDGDLDLAVGIQAVGSFNGTTSLHPGRLYRNDGSGHFVDASSQLSVPARATTAVALGDVDGDDDLDIVWGVAPVGTCGWCGPPVSGRNLLSINLHRQLDARTELRIGQTWTLDAYLRTGQPVANAFALPFASFAPASIPVPGLGVVGIDPSHAVALPLIPISPTTGDGSLSLPIVNDPGLVGTQVYAQSVMIPFPLQPTLSNVEFDIVGQ